MRCLWLVSCLLLCDVAAARASRDDSRQQEASRNDGRTPVRHAAASSSSAGRGDRGWDSPARRAFYANRNNREATSSIRRGNNKEQRDLQTTTCDPPFSCDGGCGDCNQVQNTTGCSCAACECVVCNEDPFCCSPFGRWDATCVFGNGLDFPGAVGLCECGSPAPSSSPAPSTSFAPSQSPSISTEPTGETCNTVQPPFTCNGSCGNCNEIHDGPGCDCFECECAVCAEDEFCCRLDGTWDNVCVNGNGLDLQGAAGLCECGTPQPSVSPAPTSSFLPSLEPSSSAEPTGETCAQVTPPYTCDDGSCGNCNEIHGGVGCDCFECECAVCAEDPFCCGLNGGTWDNLCVNGNGLDLVGAVGLCDCGSAAPSVSPEPSAPPVISLGPTFPLFPTSFSDAPSFDKFTPPPSTDECVEFPDCGNGCFGCDEYSFDPGCPACPKCQCQVCNLDPFCCETQWDRKCAELATYVCDCELAPTAAPTQQCGPPPYTCDGNCGDCNDPHRPEGEAGCTCEPCKCEVCRFDDFCCVNDWDQICADAAQALCECGTAAPSEEPSSYPSVEPTEVSEAPSSEPTIGQCKGTCDEGCGFCFLPARYPGCRSCKDCAEIVCGMEETAYCCEMPWDATCAAAAEMHCECCMED